MPSHASFIVIIVTKENYTSLTQGLAKYQIEENEFRIVHWKYFYPYNQPYTEFSAGDIVMFAGKFVVENLDQYITVSYPCIIATGDSERAFAADEIPLSAPHCMFTIQVTRDPKELEGSTYFDATNSQYNSVTNSKNVLMKLRVFYPTNAPRFSFLRPNSIKTNKTYIVSGFIRRVTTDFTIIELTDIDFISTNVSSVQYVQESTSSNTSNNRSFIDLIAEDVDSTTSQQSKRTRIITSRSSKQSTVPPPIVNEPETPILTPTPVNIGPETFQSQKGKKKLSDLALNCLEPITVNSSQDRRTRVEDAPDDDNDNLEFLLQQEANEDPKKTRSGRTSKKSKK